MIYKGSSSTSVDCRNIRERVILLYSKLEMPK